MRWMVHVRFLVNNHVSPHLLEDVIATLLEEYGIFGSYIDTPISNRWLLYALCTCLARLPLGSCSLTTYSYSYNHMH